LKKVGANSASLTPLLVFFLAFCADAAPTTHRYCALAFSHKLVSLTYATARRVLRFFAPTMLNVHLSSSYQAFVWIAETTNEIALSLKLPESPFARMQGSENPWPDNKRAVILR